MTPFLSGFSKVQKSVLKPHDDVFLQPCISIEIRTLRSLSHSTSLLFEVSTHSVQKKIKEKHDSYQHRRFPFRSDGCPAWGHHHGGLCCPNAIFCQGYSAIILFIFGLGNDHFNIWQQKEGLSTWISSESGMCTTRGPGQVLV